MTDLMNTTQMTMSSLEISDLVESKHPAVKLSIKRLMDKEVIRHSPMAKVINKAGQTVEIYNINKRDSYVVVAQLSPEFTGALVDRWQELEAKQTPTSYIEALEALLIAEKEKVKLLEDNSELKIKLNEHDDWYSVKAMGIKQRVVGSTEYNWRKLKQSAAKVGIERKDIPDQNYGTVKAYHIDVWHHAYPNLH